MQLNARTITVGASLMLHLGLGVAAVWYAGLPKARKAHTVAVMGDQKKKEEKKVEKPKPLPPPKPRPATKADVAPMPMPTPVAKSEAPPPKSSAPHVGGEFSNSGGGGDRSGSGKGGDGSGGGGKGTPAPTVKAPVAKKISDEDACTEAPSKPTPVNRPTEIEYTQQARADGIEGRLVLKIIVGADGSVVEVIVVKSVDPSLDAAAIAAVKSWVFKPAQRCGKPSNGGVYMVAQRFELGD